MREENEWSRTLNLLIQFWQPGTHSPLSVVIWRRLIVRLLRPLSPRYLQLADLTKQTSNCNKTRCPLKSLFIVTGWLRFFTWRIGVKLVLVLCASNCHGSLSSWNIVVYYDSVFIEPTYRHLFLCWKIQSRITGFNRIAARHPVSSLFTYFDCTCVAAFSIVTFFTQSSHCLCYGG